MKKTIGTLALGLAIAAGSLGATGVTAAEPSESGSKVVAREDCVESTLSFMSEMADYGFSDSEITSVSNWYYAFCTGW